MRDLRRISIIAALLLVVLRLAIGWQLFDEGLWKFGTQSTADPWSAEPYLRNAQGPLKEQFRELTGDPYNENWLDYDRVSERWNEWRDRFVEHYDLDEEQKKLLEGLIDGFSIELKWMPEGLTIPKEFKDTMVYDEANQELRLLDPTRLDEAKEFSAIMKTVRPLAASLRSKQIPLKQELLDGIAAQLAGRMPGDVIVPEYFKDELKFDDGAGKFELLSKSALATVLEWQLFLQKTTFRGQPLDVVIKPLDQEKLQKIELLSNQIKGVTDFLHKVRPQQPSDESVPDTLFTRSQYVASVRKQYPKWTYPIGMRGRLKTLLKPDPKLYAQLTGKRDPAELEEPKQDARNIQTQSFKIQQYRAILESYREMEPDAKRDTERTHLQQKLAELRDVLAPVKALDAELKAKAFALLNPDQAAEPRLRESKPYPLSIIDPATIYALMVLGGLLMLGFFTRIAALAAAAMIFSFYLAYPPFPGVVLPPGPEHALFVNKNLIEGLALLVLVFVPSGTWFGVDALFSGLFRTEDDD